MAEHGHGNGTTRREGDWAGLAMYVVLCLFCAIPCLAFVGGCS